MALKRIPGARSEYLPRISFKARGFKDEGSAALLKFMNRSEKRIAG